MSKPSGEPVSAHERALRLLAGRPHFRAELGRKLAARGYAAAEVTAALDRCAAQGYLDDEATARSYVAERQQRMGLGRTRLAAELRRRGVAAAVVSVVLGGIGEEDELARAREAAAKWQRKGGASAAALARHLDRKGFSRRAILAALEGAGAADEVELPDAEAEPAD